MPVCYLETSGIIHSNEWQDYWMDYKAFKTRISEIGKEKSEKEKEIQTNKEHEGKVESDVNIDISIGFSYS